MVCLLPKHFCELDYTLSFSSELLVVVANCLLFLDKIILSVIFCVQKAAATLRLRAAAACKILFIGDFRILKSRLAFMTDRWLSMLYARLIIMSGGNKQFCSFLPLLQGIHCKYRA